MRRTISTLFIIVISQISVYAQEGDKALGKLEYDLMRAYVPAEESSMHVQGEKNYFTSKHTLYFGSLGSLDIESAHQPISVLRSAGNTRVLSQEEIENNPDLKNALGNRSAASPAEIANTLFKKYDDNIHLSIRNQHGLSVIDTDTLAPIDWRLTDEEKRLDGYLVHKATATFRGRNYTAWYTKTIPVPAGPWKLHGLPGLIIEAYDDTGEIKMIITKLEVPVLNETPVTKPVAQGKVVSREEFVEAQRKKNLDAQRMRRASGASGTPPATTQTIKYVIASLEKS